MCVDANNDSSVRIWPRVGSTATLAIAESTSLGGMACSRVLTDQNLVHACCTASRGSEGAAVVRLDEASEVDTVETSRVYVTIAENSAGEFADRVR